MPSAFLPRTTPRSLLEAATESGQFDVLVRTVRDSGLAATLEEEGPFTLFAPTDLAFARLPAEEREAMRSDPERLLSVLQYHLLAGRYTTTEVAGIPSATSLQGGALAFSSGPGVRVNEANLVRSDLIARNGVLHAIDRVLLPS